MPQTSLGSIQSIFRQSGNLSALNVTAAGLIKSNPGYLGQVIVNAPGTGGAFSIYDANAYVTAQTITGITVAAQAVVTVSTGGSTNPFAVGSTITFASVVGMTQINGVVGTVTAIGGVTTAWTITTSINSSAFTAWSSAGSATSFGAGNLVWTGPEANTALVLAGQVFQPLFPMQYGIVVGAIATGGGIISISYN